MPRQDAFEAPVDPSQFGPLQMRPRALLALAMSGLARWLAAHVVPYPRLVDEHRTGLVFTLARLDYAHPDLRFADADWLVVTSRVRVSESGTYLALDVDIAARPSPGADPDRPVASFHADLRVVSIVERHALTALPGELAPGLLARFERSEVYRPDRAALARDATPPEGAEVLAPVAFETVLCRSHCEVADQWSFIEVMELATAARERLLLLEEVPDAVGTMAVARPTGSLVAVFHRAMYLFDTCRISTRVLAAPRGGAVVAHAFSDRAREGSCVTAWEILRGDAAAEGGRP